MDAILAAPVLMPAVASSAISRQPSARIAVRGKPHTQRTTLSAPAERRRQQRARQHRPNIAGLPRSAQLAAVEAALRRRISAVTTHPLPNKTSALIRAPRRTLWRRLGDASARSVANIRRLTPATPAARAFPTLTPAALTGATPTLATVMRISPTGAAQTRRIIAARRRSHTGAGRFISLLLLVAFALALIPTPMLAYNNTLALAKSGVAHLKSAEATFKTLATNPTNLALITDAQDELQQAHDDFSQLQLRMDLLNSAKFIPVVDARLAGASKLVPLAVEGTQAGVLACDALRTLVVGMRNPLGTTGGLTSADMSQITSDMDQIQALYTQMAPQIQSLTPSDLALAPTLWPTVSGLQARLPEVTQLVNDLDGAAHELPQLLGVGKPATYLVLVLDSSELRPTGGFIGNFGALTLDSGRLDPGFHISDITLIDSSVKFSSARYQQFIPIPSSYGWLRAVFADPNGASWSLRDSNLDPNYPTAAQYALQLYPKLLPDAQKNLRAQGSTLQLYDPAKSGQFAGVITLSLGLFEQALRITGPISVPRFHETITADNFVSKIHSYALGAKATGPDSQACGDTSCAKVFTSDVVKAFMTKIKSNLPLYIGQMSRLLYDSLHTKDVEVYLTQPQAQQLLSNLNLSAEVEAPATGDSVFEVDANIGANKDNYFLQYQMADQITIDTSGAATHRLTWSYRWPRDPATLKETFAAGSPDYQAYARVYTPPKATFISQKGLASFGTGSEFGRKVFHGSVSDSYGQTSSYALAWKVPSVVTRDATGYHYRLIFQREAGIVWPLAVTVHLPKCASLTGAPVTSGLTAQNAVTVNGNAVTITGPLTRDAQVELNYTCASSASASARTSPAFITSKQLRDHHWQAVAQRLGQHYQPRRSR
jgi:hypothetical protein